MKKSLLFACAAGLVLSAGAQNTANHVVNIRNINRQAICTESATNSANPTTPVQRKKPLVITNLAISDIGLGNSGNAFGGYTRPARSICYADPNLNAVIVTHRSGPSCTPGDGTATTGSIMFDYSKDGGSTWNTPPSLGPVFDAAVELGRYPNGVIYNPTGNTNADNAYIAVYGPCTDGANWIADHSGAAQLGNPGTTATQNTFWYDSIIPYHGLIPDAMVITQQGTAWVIDQANDGSASYVYTDSFAVRKGVWNNTTHIFDYTTKMVPYPTTAGGGNVTGEAIAFAPNGQTGYIVASATDGSTSGTTPDTSNYLVVFKTTDGGATWGAPVNIPVAAQAATLLGGTGSFTTAFNPDAVVGADGKLYVNVSIFPYLGGGSIGVAAGTWGQFAVITDGTTHSFHLLDKPQTFKYTTTGAQAITEYTRGQVAMNWAGNKMVFVWFDTDTTVFPGGTNTNPNVMATFYDASTSSWGGVQNLTANTTADGVVTFGDLSYYLLPGSTAGGFKIPISYQALTLGDESGCVQWHYLNGIEMTAVNELANNVFSIADAYPNPTSGVSTIEINMKKADNISIEVSNMLGQVVYTTSANLTTGTHKFNVETSNWNSGVYFYTVKSTEFTVTSKLVRE